MSTQTLNFRTNFNANKNSPDAIEEMEEQHKTIVEMLRRNLD